MGTPWMDVGDSQPILLLVSPEEGHQVPFAKELPNSLDCWQEPLYKGNAKASHAESQNCHRSLCKPIFTSLSVAHQRRTRKLQTQCVNLGLLSGEKKKQSRPKQMLSRYPYETTVPPPRFLFLWCISHAYKHSSEPLKLYSDS